VKPFDPTTRCQHCGGLRREHHRRAPYRCPTRLAETYWTPWTWAAYKQAEKDGMPILVGETPPDTAPEGIITPETSNLAPITYEDAMALYAASDRRPFSFLAAPDGELKTILVMRDGAVGASPHVARQCYEFDANQQRARR
jgi:hypothetical protein